MCVLVCLLLTVFNRGLLEEGSKEADLPMKQVKESGLTRQRTEVFILKLVLFFLYR